METCGDQSGYAREQRERRSFNPSASVELARGDLQMFGEVLPETTQRICDNELSLLVEGMDRAACTAFTLPRQGDELVYHNNGKWDSYTGMLLVGREVAELEARADPRKQFLYDDAVADLAHGYGMRALKPGEQRVWSSPYRYDIQQRYGREFMSSCGRFPDRAMGFLYRASCDDYGNVTLESQTVDNSDDEAFAAALDLAANNPTADMDAIRGAYDDVLSAKHGEPYYAGRTDAQRNENAWEQLLAQRDLIAYFISGIEQIARTDLQGDALEDAAKRHTYGVWAACKNRFDYSGTVASEVASMGMLAAPQYGVSDEVNFAFNQFVNAGIAMVGCGGEISILKGEKALLSASAEDVFDALFSAGNPKREVTDKYGSLSFSCPKGHQNERPLNTLISHCRSCGVSVGCAETAEKSEAGKMFKDVWERLSKEVIGEKPAKEEMAIAV